MVQCPVVVVGSGSESGNVALRVLEYTQCHVAARRTPRVKTFEESLTIFKDNEVSFEEARIYNVYIHCQYPSSYNIVIKFNIIGKKLDVDKLRKSCHYILSNNKILQCNYVVKNGKIHKQYNPKDVIISDRLD